MRITKKYKYKDLELTLKEISDMTGVDKVLIYNRLRRGWDMESAINVEVGNNGGGSTPSKGSIDKEHMKNRQKNITTFAQCAYRSN